MKTLKKIIAWSSAVALLAMNAAYAATIGTTTNDGGTSTWAVNSSWDGTSDPDTSTASWSSSVAVTAQVAPTLSMTISTWAINFGTLAPTVVATGTLSIVTTTNAEGGIGVAMTSNGLHSATKFIGNYSNVGAATSDATDFYKVVSATNAWGTGLASQDIAASNAILAAGNVVQANATTTVNVTAMAWNQTEAGNYSDTLTFTVTGTF